MTSTVAILVTDTERAEVEAAINDLTPEYTIGFIRACAAINPAMLHTEPATHWYTNASGVPNEIVSAWQAAAAAMTGVVLFIAINAENPLDWAYSNLASQGLQFVPYAPD